MLMRSFAKTAQDDGKEKHSLEEYRKEFFSRAAWDERREEHSHRMM